MEAGMLVQKPWQMSGEITAGKRPENSLLQENLDFEYTTRLGKCYIVPGTLTILYFWDQYMHTTMSQTFSCRIWEEIGPACEV